MTTAEGRTKLHDLVETLPSEDVPAALRILESLRSGPVPLSEIPSGPVPLSEIPFDDEPETEEERAAVAGARRDIEAGRVISHDEVMRKYGL
jgi:hypothetical protein